MQSAIECVGVHKYFGPVHANCDIHLNVAAGSIHGIVGENGAGKSTLMSILYGYYEASAGTLRIKGQAVKIASPADAIRLGIGMVHQHFMLIETFSVLENILLGSEGGPLLAPGRSAMRAKLTEFADRYGLAVDPDARIADLGVGMRQRVEILKALMRGANILILDEPTAVLTPDEADSLFIMLRRLRDEGKTILMITHKLREIIELTDHVSVMRRGRMVGHFTTAQTNMDELAKAMVGRPIALDRHKPPCKAGRVILDVRDLVVRNAQGKTCVDHVSFHLREGEIIGLAGVAGNGQSEVLQALAGMCDIETGTINLDGQELDLNHMDPRRMRAKGLMHVPEDRHHHGLVMNFDACESAILGFHRDAIYGRGLLDRSAMRSALAQDMEAYDIRPRNPQLRTRNFSGGNQQKIVLSREIEREPKVLLIGQPTRGVDVGAIEFIHNRLLHLREEGKAILLVSVELDEIIALSDRILVICDGRITGERTGLQTDIQDLGLLMGGVNERVA